LKVNKEDTWKFRWFTSTSNPNTTSYWEKSLVQITIHTNKAKDLTWISLISNFWDKLKGIDWKIIWKTEQESILLPNTKYKVEKAPFINIDWKWSVVLEEL
jgi:hypothetical protein